MGRDSARAVKSIIESKRHPELGYRACLGIMRLSRDHGSQRLDAACKRALTFDICSYRSIKSILKTKLDKESLPGSGDPTSLLVNDHENVRGEAYYKSNKTKDKKENYNVV